MSNHFAQWYASYVSAYVWCGLFLGPKIARLWKSRSNLEGYHKDRLRLVLIPVNIAIRC